MTAALLSRLTTVISSRPATTAGASKAPVRQFLMTPYSPKEEAGLPKCNAKRVSIYHVALHSAGANSRLMGRANRPDLLPDHDVGRFHDSMDTVTDFECQIVNRFVGDRGSHRDSR